MKIAIGSDHGGFDLKRTLAEFLKKKGHNVEDCGTYSPGPCDYPQFAFEVAVRVGDRRAEKGVLICKSGIGTAIVANKVPGVRAAVCNSEEEAKLSREHNDANIIVFGSKFISAEGAGKALSIWLNTEHAGGRHKKRVDQIAEIEKRILEERK